jgi:hypothetical protein
MEPRIAKFKSARPGRPDTAPATAERDLGGERETGNDFPDAALPLPEAA